jgi:hypothetical protein
MPLKATQWLQRFKTKGFSDTITLLPLHRFKQKGFKVKQSLHCFKKKVAKRQSLHCFKIMVKEPKIAFSEIFFKGLLKQKNHFIGAFFRAQIIGVALITLLFF